MFLNVNKTIQRIGVVRISLVLASLVLALLVAGVWDFLNAKYTDISTNGSNTCGVRTDGTVRCWGGWRPREPAPDGPFVAVAAGAGNACGLREDGSVSCWGYIYEKSSDLLPPDPGEEVGGGPFTEITAGGWHFCGLRPDGTVACWGDDEYGQASPPDGERFTTISAGRITTCGLRPDGTALCWGSEGESVMSTGDFVPDRSSGESLRAFGAYAPPDDEKFKAISSHDGYFCGIRLNEDVVCWGVIVSKYFSRSRIEGREILSPDIEGPFASLDTGLSHACGLHPDGTVHCWGFTSTYENADFGADYVSGERFLAISSGRHYNCGIRQNGTLKCWGGLEVNRLGSGIHPERLINEIRRTTGASLGLAIIFSIFFVLVFSPLIIIAAIPIAPVLGWLWAPCAFLICRRMASNREFYELEVGLAGALYSTLFFWPWAYFVLRMKNSYVAPIWVKLFYALIYPLCLIGSVGMWVFYVVIASPQFADFAWFNWIGYVFILALIVPTTFIWFTSLRNLLRRYGTAEPSVGTASSELLDRGYIMPLVYVFGALLPYVVMVTIVLYNSI